MSVSSGMRRMSVLIAIAVLSAAGPLRGQESLDRGSFVLMRGAAETGRVEFSVRPTSGQRGNGGLLVTGTTHTPAKEVSYILEVSADLAPVSYQLTETVGGHAARRVSAQITGPRFSARAATEAGDVARELPVRAPFVILSADDFTSYLFVPRPDAGTTRTLNAVRTETLSGITGTVTGEGDDNVTVGGQSVACRRYLLKLADGETHQFWITATGSLLQVSTPATGITATRTQAPPR
jgi:hypothetical protein